MADETKYGTTVLGKESLKLSNAAQQRVAVAHGETYRIPSRSKTCTPSGRPAGGSG